MSHFRVLGAVGVPIALTGWNQELIAANTAVSPQAGTTTPLPYNWVWYEQGAPVTTQGLPASGSFVSAFNSIQASLFNSSPTPRTTLSTPVARTDVALANTGVEQDGSTWVPNYNGTLSLFEHDYTLPSADAGGRAALALRSLDIL